jgi:hypothetical protein
LYRVIGAFALATGDVARRKGDDTSRVPARLGGWLIGIEIAAPVLMPASSFWLLAALGVAAVTAGGFRDRTSRTR